MRALPLKEKNIRDPRFRKVRYSASQQICLIHLVAQATDVNQVENDDELHNGVYLLQHDSFNLTKRLDTMAIDLGE